MLSTPSIVVVTGANGLVGSRMCEALVKRGVGVRAIVRRAGTAPQVPAVTEVVGDFAEPDFAAMVVASATSVVTTVHPMGSNRATQQRVAVTGTPVLARAAASAGVGRLIHISTAAVYDRSPGVPDVDEFSALVGDDADDYAVTKRDTDLALAKVDGITRVLLRPPAILGAGPTSVWNSLRPAAMRDDEQARRAIADATFAWVHLADLTSLAADLASGRIVDATDAATGPVPDACTPLNVAAARATQRDYFQAVCGALGVDPVWQVAPAWTGRIVADRAHLGLDDDRRSCPGPGRDRRRPARRFVRPPSRVRLATRLEQRVHGLRPSSDRLHGHAGARSLCCSGTTQTDTRYACLESLEAGLSGRLQLGMERVSLGMLDRVN